MHLPKIEFSTALKAGDTIVLGWSQGESVEKSGKDTSKKKEKSGDASPAAPSAPPPQYGGKRSKDTDALAERLKSSEHFRGKKNEVDLLRFVPFGQHPNVLLLGLGSRKKFDGETARQTGASFALVQKREKLKNVVVMADSLFGGASGAKLNDLLQAFCEGYLMAGHEFSELKKKEKAPYQSDGFTFAGLKAAGLEKAVKRAEVIARAVQIARNLGDKPGNFVTPAILATETQAMAKEVNLKCRVMNRAEIEKEKMGLLIGVAKGSHEEPRFIVMEHNGGKKTDRPIALVGKGVTFDSGGISLKPAHQMEDMKYDMMGAAAVIGICYAAAALKLPVNIMGFVAAAENMPGGSAQKPGDVARSISGKTVEITNTDAEGRLILADALEYAQKYEPQAIFDFATLTGAVVVALGTVCTGIMGTSKELIGRIKQASEATAERVWELPLFEEYEEDLKSHYADIKNSGVRDAGSSKGGCFLKFFVESKYPWVHFDIAGAAYHRKDLNYHPSKYASGVMIRLMVNALENWKTLK